MTSSSHSGSICILPVLKGLGGPTSFAGRLISGLRARGIEVHHNPLDPTCTSLLVIGGARRLDLIYRAKRRGVRVVQRLNGMNWLHRKVHTGLRHYLRSEINNRVLATIRGSLADAIVYQSQFARNWWQTVYGPTRAAGRVVYNGVDLDVFTPQGPGERPDGYYRVLMVEGHMAGGYEMGLESGVRLVQELNRNMTTPVRLTVAGDVAEPVWQQWQQEAGKMIEWIGIVPGEGIPSLDRSAHVLFSADLNAACPNSVVEALACGLPVVSFATGSLPELIAQQAGRVVPYGSNYWNLEKPDVAGLAEAARQVLLNQPDFRRAARARAEESFGLDEMTEKYLEALR